METLVQSTAVEAVAPGAGPAEPDRRWWRLYLPAIVVLAVGMALPLYGGYFLKAAYGTETHRALAGYGPFGTAEVTLKLLLLCLILVVVHYWEGLSVRSVGLKWPSWSDAGVGFALFTAVTISITAAGLIANALFPGSAAFAHIRERLGLFYRIPIGMLAAIAITNGIVEEVYARGYAIDRLERITHSATAAVIVALGIDLMLHVPYWGWSYTAIIAPGQVLFALAYVWRRDLAANFVAHIMNDIAPLTAVAWAPLVAAIFFHQPFYDAQGSMFLQRADYQSAVLAYSRALSRNSTDVNALLGRARALRDEKKYDRAIKDFDRAVALRPTSENFDDRALVYYDAGQYQHAADEVALALTFDPHDGYAYSMRSYLESDRRQYDLALADLGHAIECDPRGEDYYDRRGYLYAARHDYDHAIQDFEHAAKHDRSDAQVAWYLASALAAKGDYPRALAEYDRAAKLAPDWRPWACWSRAAIFQWTSDYSKALDEYRRGYQLAPDEPQALNGVAWMLATTPDQKLRDGKQAVTLAHCACELSHWSNASIVDTLAGAYAESGDFDRAVKTEHRALELTKGDLALSAGLKTHLAQFSQHRPWREARPPIAPGTDAFPLEQSAENKGTANDANR